MFRGTHKFQNVSLETGETFGITNFLIQLIQFYHSKVEGKKEF